jgi:hypothetical protein
MKGGAPWLAALLALSCGRTEATHDVGGKQPQPNSASARWGTVDAAPADVRITAQTWQGTYDAAAGSLRFPAELKGVSWSPSDTTSGLGDGTLRLRVDPSGRVGGELSAPLGPALVNGYRRDQRLTANFARVHPEDHGYTGVLDGTIEDGRILGQLSASPGAASAVRTASFTLSRSDATEERR